VTANEREAINGVLRRAGVLGGRAAALATAVAKILGVLVVGAGIEIGFSDGDEFDDVGCTVAQRPAAVRGAHAGQSRERAGGKVGESDKGSGDGGGGGSAGAGRPECEVRAEACAHRMKDGRCRRLGRRCRLIEVRSAECGMSSGI
jgi:hypothetical protein